MKTYRIGYGLFVALLLGFALLMQDRYMMAMLFSFTLLPLVSLLFLVISFHKVSLVGKPQPQTIQKGVEHVIQVQIEQNGGLLCPYVSLPLLDSMNVTKQQNASYAFALPPKTHKKIQTSVQFDYCGYYQIGYQTVYAMDFLKLFRLRKPASAVYEYLVLPHIHSVYLPATYAQLSARLLKAMAFGQPDELDVIDYRQYEQQDDMRHIHWKLSSKNQHLIVKRYAAQTQIPINMVLDLAQTHAPLDQQAALLDRMLDAAVSLLSHYIMQDAAVTLWYATTQPHCQPIDSVQAFQSFYHQTPQLGFHGQIPFVQLCSYLDFSDCHEALLLLLTPSVDSPLLERVKGLMAQKVHILLVDFSLSAIDSDLADIIRQLPCVSYCRFEQLYA